MSHQLLSFRAEWEIRTHLYFIELLWIHAAALGIALQVGNRNSIIVFGGLDALHFCYGFDPLTVGWNFQIHQRFLWFHSRWYLFSLNLHLMGVNCRYALNWSSNLFCLDFLIFWNFEWKACLQIMIMFLLISKHFPWLLECCRFSVRGLFTFKTVFLSQRAVYIFFKLFEESKLANSFKVTYSLLLKFLLVNYHWFFFVNLEICFFFFDWYWPNFQ